jgi:Tol biopolymer transport system component
MVTLLNSARAEDAGGAKQQVGKEPLTDVVQLTTGFARAGEAYFSPDMKWIIFQANSPYQMYLAELKWQGDRIVGTQPPIRISPEKSHNTCGYFSPDGKSIIFGSTAGKESPNEPTGGYQRQGRNYQWAFPTGMEIFRSDDWKSAVASGGGEVDLAKRPLTNNDVYDAEASYSPDGKWITYTHGAGPAADIFVMRADGSGSVRITKEKGYDGGPFFSPDGKRLVYRSDRKGNDLLQVLVAELAFDDKGNITGMQRERQLTNDEFVNWGPYWHPGEKHIIYATSAQGHMNYELYLMNAEDGSDKRRITFTEGADVLPVFSPDGKWLMWTSKRTPDNTSQVFAARFHLPE